MSSSAQYPSLVMIIRHGEKPGDPGNDKDGGKYLSIMGSARAAALPSLFMPNPSAQHVSGLIQPMCDIKAAAASQFSGSYEPGGVKAGVPAFPVPKFLFAALKDSSSHRPSDTITPLGQALGLKVEMPYANNDYAKLEKQIMKDDVSTYANKVVLICWHHGNIPGLAESFGVPDQQLKTLGLDAWPPTVFDLVLMLTWPKGTLNFAVEYQQLLFNDAPAPSSTRH
jgi:hypothetical protein